MPIIYGTIHINATSLDATAERAVNTSQTRTKADCSENLTHLSIKSGSRIVGGHGLVGHGSPGVVLGGGLGVPHITGIASQLVTVHDLH